MDSQLNTYDEEPYIECTFNGCEKRALSGTDKCRFHRNRRQCSVNGCTNQVYARKLCVRHGGKKQCQVDGCYLHARGGSLCLHHGGFAVKRFCQIEGCTKQAHARQLCVRHGGGRKCKTDGCTQHARAGGLCNRHSQGHRCQSDGCSKVAQHDGIYCFNHAMERRALGESTGNVMTSGATGRRKKNDTNKPSNHPYNLMRSGTDLVDPISNMKYEQSSGLMINSASSTCDESGNTVTVSSAQVSYPSISPQGIESQFLGTNEFANGSHPFYESTYSIQSTPTPSLPTSELQSLMGFNDPVGSMRDYVRRWNAEENTSGGYPTFPNNENNNFMETYGKLVGLETMIPNLFDNTETDGYRILPIEYPVGQPMQVMPSAHVSRSMHTTYQTPAVTSSVTTVPSESTKDPFHALSKQDTIHSTSQNTSNDSFHVNPSPKDSSLANSQHYTFTLDADKNRVMQLNTSSSCEDPSRMAYGIRMPNSLSKLSNIHEIDQAAG